MTDVMYYFSYLYLNRLCVTTGQGLEKQFLDSSRPKIQKSTSACAQAPCLKLSMCLTVLRTDFKGI